MSYDISFRVKVEGLPCWVDVGDCDANITWNVRKIIEVSTGLPWLNEEDNGLCTEVIPAIEKGLKALEANPDAYRKYNSPNGWGTVEGVIRFFERILQDWESFSREYPELAGVAHFWVV